MPVLRPKRANPRLGSRFAGQWGAIVVRYQFFAALLFSQKQYIPNASMQLSLPKLSVGGIDVFARAANFAILLPLLIVVLANAAINAREVHRVVVF